MNTLSTMTMAMVATATPVMEMADITFMALVLFLENR